ncbi:MAG TPA: crosslink repair DNA glycosylase YcaQ family protein [bacterium]|jgi:hypothetical protein
MTKCFKISKDEARKITVNAQLLDGQAKIPKTKNGVVKIIEQLGYVQIDTIHIVERAHNHTLWARHPSYKPEMLHSLQAKGRKVFEYRGHAASYLPMSDFRYYLPWKKAYDDPHGKWEKDRMEKFGHLMKPVLNRIKKEGPLGSADFEKDADKKSGTWWDWRPYKVALELLFWKGDLMITERKNFHRIYDLTERVLPDWVDTKYPSDDEVGRFLVRKALQAHGIMQERGIHQHIRAISRKVMTKSLKEMVDEGEVVEVEVEGTKGKKYYASENDLKNAHKKAESKEVNILCPFDNLIIYRDRTLDLFNFDYSLECYTPEKKRKFGYFVHPILYGNNLIGRMDPRADRKAGIYQVLNLSFEKGFKPDDEFLNKLGEKLSKVCEFNGCGEVEVLKTTPAGIKSKLKKILK